MSHLMYTPRLELVAASLEHVAAELCDPAGLGALLGVAIPTGWPPGEYDREAQEFFRDQLATNGPAAVGWLGWYALSREEDGSRKALVACAGYIGPPSEGSVEIGYSVMPEACGRGYASEIVAALISRAFVRPDVREIIAHTSTTNPASARVLLRNGFQPQAPSPLPGILAYRLPRPNHDPGSSGRKTLSETT